MHDGCDGRLSDVAPRPGWACIWTDQRSIMRYMPGSRRISPGEVQFVNNEAESRSVRFQGTIGAVGADLSAAKNAP
jgi:hypothetical protein